MSLQIQPKILRSIYELTQDQVPNPPTGIHSFEDAIVCLVANDSVKRHAALEYLKMENAKGHVLWGSLSPYLVFYYHVLFVKRDIEAAVELRKLLSNSVQNSQPSTFDREMYEVLTWAHSIVQTGLREDTIRKMSLSNVSSQYAEPLAQLVTQLIFVELGGMADLNPLIRRVRQDMVPLVIDEEVSETYNVPLTNNIMQAIENYFLLRADTTSSRIAGQSYLFGLKTELQQTIEQQTKRIVENRYLQISLTIVFAILLIASGVSQLQGISSPLNGPAGVITLVVSLIVFATSLPIGPLPRLTLQLVAGLATLGKRNHLRIIKKDLKSLVSNEP
jgi:hypothetical protein